MDIQQLSTPEIPKNFTVRNNISHLGKILFTISIVMFLVCITCYIAPIAYGLFLILYLFVIIIATVFSLGILLINDFFRSLWNFSNLTNLSDIIYKIAVYGTKLIYVVTIVSFVSAILMLIDFKKPTARIVVSILTFIVSLVISLFLLLGAK